MKLYNNNSQFCIKSTIKMTRRIPKGTIPCLKHLGIYSALIYAMTIDVGALIQMTFPSLRHYMIHKYVYAQSDL